MVRTEPDVIELDKRRLNVKPKVITKPNIEPNEKRKQDVKPNIKLIEKAIRMLRNLIRIKSPMKKKRQL